MATLKKPRATVRQYAALIADQVQANLEGLARARVEKHSRPYRTDAEIHQSYIKATAGGPAGPEDAPDDGELGADQAPPSADGPPVCGVPQGICRVREAKAT